MFQEQSRSNSDSWINTALWIPAFTNDEGVLDQGWSCRDYTWIIAALLSSFGLESAVMHGCTLFMTPKGNNSPGIKCILNLLQ
jgi:transglutaminase-like putative cysteine protease